MTHYAVFVVKMPEDHSAIGAEVARLAEALRTAGPGPVVVTSGWPTIEDFSAWAARYAANREG